MSKTKEPKFAAGTKMKPRVIKVPTYQGGDVEGVDFAKPLVPVTVENSCGVILTLGPKTEEHYPPEVICERRRNGWMVALNIGSDENMLLYITDDDEVTYCKSGSSRYRPEEVSRQPKELDWGPEEKAAKEDD